jgi:hypothetical protein
VSAVDAVDGLYENVVLHPDRWNEAAFADWAGSVATDLGSVDRDVARELRRALRVATKLQRFWSSPDADRHRGEQDWRSRVDLAVGPPAWRPTLELANAELAARPSEEAFEEVRDRFRLVNNQPWLEGITYEEWSAAR